MGSQCKYEPEAITQYLRIGFTVRLLATSIKHFVLCSLKFNGVYMINDSMGDAR